MPSETVILPTGVVASFFGMGSRDLAQLMGSGRGESTGHALSFADACKVAVLFATKPHVTTPKLRKVLWDAIPSSKIEEAAYAPAGKSVFLLIPVDSLRGGAFRVEFRAPGDHTQSGDLLLNLSALVREIWDETEKYLKVAMTAKARQEEGPEVELRHLDDTGKKIQELREALKRRERAGASPESLRQDRNRLGELESWLTKAKREIQKRGKGVKR